MKLEVLENEKEKMKVELIGETDTLANLLREKLWAEGAQQAAYMKEHPYLSTTKVIVHGKNPKKLLENAAQAIADEAKEFQVEFGRALQK